ncbi:MAG: hypothetical protein HC936_15930 [Leptolyngbyaceae cyanobacterium SU_3_3]|nr:hypothetical protein [Leptolyngbyaceae cyanobacterium SU_3_3]
MSASALLLPAGLYSLRMASQHKDCDLPLAVIVLAFGVQHHPGYWGRYRFCNESITVNNLDFGGCHENRKNLIRCAEKKRKEKKGKGLKGKRAKG